MIPTPSCVLVTLLLLLLWLRHPRPHCQPPQWLVVMIAAGQITRQVDQNRQLVGTLPGGLVLQLSSALAACNA
jgi:hypothetical protein